MTADSNSTPNPTRPKRMSAETMRRIESMLGADAVASGRPSDAVDGIVPPVIASPRSVNELSALLAFANDEGLAVAPRGGGTQLGLGNAAQRIDLVVDVSALNGVVQHNAADLTLVVQAGITLAALRETLAAEGQFLPLDAPLPERATIGGTLAAGVSGPTKWQYGSARDLVIGMKVMQPDGRITQSGGNVVKNVSGYDMARLHVGGLGTLGVITEVGFKLTPMPRSETTLLAQFASAADCMRAAIGVFNSGVMPIALTAFSSNVAESVGIGSGGASSSSGAYSLAVRLGARPRTLRRMENDATAVIQSHTAGRPAQVERIEQDAAAFWAELADFGHADGSPTAMSARISVLPSKIADAAQALPQQRGVAIVAHPGYGMMSAHWLGGGGDLRADIVSARDAVHALGGSLIVERAPAAVKQSLDVWDYTGDSIEVMRRLKAQYDPNGILNPNRFTGGI